MKKFDRRNFLLTGSASIAGLAITPHLKATSSTAPGKPRDIINRKLGTTGIEIPVISMGCGKLDSPAIVKAALNLGITHFDTAHGYRQGNSERVLGEVLSPLPRNSYTVATKIKAQDTEEKFFELLDISLERLKIEYVDILYLHAVSSRDVMLNHVMLNAMKKAKALGKTKNIGISIHKNELEVLQAAIDCSEYDVVLLSRNFKQKHGDKLANKIATAASKGIGIIGMKVMAGGFLDKEKLQPVNCKAALKWVLQDKNIHTTIPTILNLDQLQENASVLKDIELNNDEKALLALNEKQSGLYCNACSQCVDSCRKYLPIPELMRAYMYAYGHRDLTKAKELISELGNGDSPCASCSECSTSCILDFDLKDKITDISRLNKVPADFVA